MKNALSLVRTSLDALDRAIYSRDWDAVALSMCRVLHRLETAERMAAVTAALSELTDPVAEVEAADGSTVVIFSGPAMDAAHATSERDDDTATRLKRTYRRLRMSGAQRPLRSPVDDWRAQVDQLEAAFPNFSAVVNGSLKSHLAMLELGSRARLPPMLLVGPPGVGKTHFAAEMAAVLQVPMQTVSFASATNGSALAGSSVFWSNSNHGRLAECLAWGPAGQDPVANPLVLLDEIDKSSSELHYDPLGALYSLLEISTAANFEDEALPDLQIATQYVSWIATANKIDSIPEPIRSRLFIYEIEPPSPSQARSIAKQIFADVVLKTGIEFSIVLPESVLDSMSDLSPRAMKTRLSVCVGLAVYAGRRCVLLEDWIHTRPQDSKRQRIGFSHA